MSRKEKRSSETAQKIFPQRLQALMDGPPRTSQPKLASAIGVQRQTVSNYTTGQSSPDWEALAKIAAFFNVSADYLLGLSDARTVDVTVKGIQEFTGLDENTIWELNLEHKSKKYGDFLQSFVGRIASSDFIADTVSYFLLKSAKVEFMRRKGEVLDDGAEIGLSPSDISGLFLSKAETLIVDSISDVIEATRNNILESMISAGTSDIQSKIKLDLKWLQEDEEADHGE